MRNRVVKLIKNEKNYLKWTSNPSYVAQKIFDNDLTAIHKIKTTLTIFKKQISQQFKIIIHQYWQLVHETETGNIDDNFSKNKKIAWF